MNPVWVAILVLLAVEEAGALQEPKLCYILDAVLFLYGIVLTLLYCRLKIQYRKKAQRTPASAVYEKMEGVYTGLSAREPETYTTLEFSKRHPQTQPAESKPISE